MRLIDADAFDTTLRYGEVKALERHNTKLSSVIQMIRGNLRKAPTIEEREKGRWIRTRTMFHDGELYCDQCGQEHPEQKRIWSFCPNCGADMRKAKFDGEKEQT